VATELASTNRPAIREQISQRLASTQRMEAADVADVISYIVSRPRHVAINEVLVRPTEQQQ
jgi:NADP-dependent 3-hydroxy acid dehydrogenase YdfG